MIINRLEGVKEDFARDYLLDHEDIEWLIEQAERVREMEETITERYRGYVTLLDENKQLREVLEHIAEHFFLGEGHEDADQVANSLIGRAREGLGKGWWLND